MGPADRGRREGREAGRFYRGSAGRDQSRKTDAALIHIATPSFWKRYHELPRSVQKRADKAFLRMKSDPSHPSLHFKNSGELWSARVSQKYRAWRWRAVLALTGYGLGIIPSMTD